jgi:hypothetical protein
MTLLEEVIELDTMLANDGYKSWGYARLTLDKVIKALTAPPDVNQHVIASCEQRAGHTREQLPCPVCVWAVSMSDNGRWFMQGDNLH